VFRADFQQSKWSKVTTIGDNRVLFLRRRCSRLVPVSQEGMPGDRIIFIDKDNEAQNLCDGDGSLDSCSVYELRHEGWLDLRLCSCGVVEARLCAGSRVIMNMK
jgi:hypothetical protein